MKLPVCFTYKGVEKVLVQTSKGSENEGLVPVGTEASKHITQKGKMYAGGNGFLLKANTIREGPGKKILGNFPTKKKAGNIWGEAASGRRGYLRLRH